MRIHAGRAGNERMGLDVRILLMTLWRARLPD